MPKKNSFTDIYDIVNDYSKDVQEGIVKAAKDNSKQIVSDLKSVRDTYKVRTGSYNNGWTINTKKGRGHINCTVWNSTDWRLTHLLEFGHNKRNGGKTRAFVHIAPIEKKYVDKYETDVESVIKNGGK